MVSKIATFRLPENLLQEIRSRAEATGRDRTAVVIEALKQSFGLPPSEPRPATVEELHAQLNELEKQFTTLTQQLTKLTQGQPSEARISRISQALRQEIASDQPLTTADSLLPWRAFYAQTMGLSEGGGGNGDATKQGLEYNLTEDKPGDTEVQELAARIEQQARIFDQVLSASPDPICVLDRMGRFTYVNLAIAQLFRLQQHQMLGRTWKELDLPPEVLELDAQREVVFATKRPLTQEISYPTLNGIRDYECILSPILSASGSVEAVICTARDITERNQVETSLRESEANYRHLFEYANDSIFIIDLSTSRLLDANQNAARRLGYTRQELLKLTTRDIDVPIAESRQKKISQQLQATGSIIFDHALRRKDGTEIQVEISSRIIEYRNRLVSLSFVRDITARKQIEERLRLLESAVKNSKDGILITEAGHLDKPSPKLLYVNKAFTSITGYDLAEVLGQTPRMLQGPKTDRNQLDKIRTALSRQEPVQAELVNYRKDGSEFWVELNIVPVVNKRGNLTHWLAVQRDITERKQVEAFLQESEAQFHTMFDMVPVMVWMADPDQRCTYLNNKWLEFTGQTLEQGLGNGWSECIHPEDKERCLHTYTRAFEAKQEFKLEYRLRRFDGEYRQFLMTGKPRFTFDGSFAGYITSSVKVKACSQV